MDECRQKAAELGMPLGAPDSGVGFEVPASGYFTKGCFCYRICQKGQYASGHYRWRVFYGVVTPGQDVTPEEAAQPTGGAAPNQNSRQQVGGTQDQHQMTRARLSVTLTSLTLAIIMILTNLISTTEAMQIDRSCLMSLALITFRIRICRWER